MKNENTYLQEQKRIFKNEDEINENKDADS